MIKKFFKITILILIFLIIFVGYFSYFGINTTKFNTLIKNQINNQYKYLDIELKKVRLHLNIKNFSIQIKTQNPEIIINNANIIKLDEISSDISITSYLKNTFAIKNLSIKSKNNEISRYLDLYKKQNIKKFKIILLKQALKNGIAQINAQLYFDDFGNIKKNYLLTGKVFNAEIKIPYNIKELNFNFIIKNNNFNFDKIQFKFNKIKFNSENIIVNKKNEKFYLKGNLKSQTNKINDDLIFLLFDSNLKNLDFSNSKFDSNSEFSLELGKKLKVKNLEINSKVNLDKFIFNNNLQQAKNYIMNFNDIINLDNNKINIKYSKNKFEITGSSEFYIEKKFKNLLNFNISKNKNKIKFDTFLNLKNIHLNFANISYNKIKKDDASLRFKGYKINDITLFKNINYIENGNKIEINNLKIKNNKLLGLEKIKLNYSTINKFKNNLILSKKNKNYELIGNSFDTIQLIENITNAEPNKNFFDIFENLNTKIIININKIKLDEENFVSNLKGNINIKNSKIFSLNLNSKFSSNEKMFLSIKTQKDNAVITTFYSDRAKPFVKKYKFIKGFEEGNLDFSSKKINNLSNSKLIIDNFKVQEVPVLAKLLTLASLQGIADLLTGEGVRFTDFEMIYSNKDNLMTIEEIYAIGPAISIMMEGYVEGKDLVSLRGTLVPATTINRSISSIPLLGDLLVGKKVGEGIFGVSFKIKGPPKDLKTKVNPIKTLTPRFITRTLEKIKK
tara:strand:- start:737 stop:2935 length:2199 start_codon:yes stop_codon:yes gene_type:complete